MISSVGRIGIIIEQPDLDIVPRIREDERQEFSKGIGIIVRQARERQPDGFQGVEVTHAHALRVFGLRSFTRRLNGVFSQVF